MSNARNIADLAGDTSNLEAISSAYGAGALSNRNLIINGAMQVAQRGNYTITTTGSPEYGGTDRFHMWSYTGTEQVVGDVTQSTDVPSGQGFAYSRQFDVTTAESAVAADEALLIAQYIEAQNLQHLAYGTSSAKDVTMSFWIKSTKTGTYCFYLQQHDGDRIYIKEYTVDASDTWEHKTITIPGDISGTINNDNGRGLWCAWVLMAGANRHGTANEWRATGADYATSNQVNAVDSTSNNIYLTGVQLEVGDTATPFEHRSYGQELALCQRYYFTTFTTKAPQNGTSLGGQDRYYSPAWRHSAGSGLVGSMFNFPTPMRAAPTVTFYNDTGTSSSSGNWGFYDGNAWTNAVSMGTITLCTYHMTPSLDMGISSDFNHNYLIRGGFSTDAEL